MREQPERLELGELRAHGRGAGVDPDRSTSVFEPTGWPGRDVLLDDAPQDLLLAERQLNVNGHLQAF